MRIRGPIRRPIQAISMLAVAGLMLPSLPAEGTVVAAAVLPAPVTVWVGDVSASTATPIDVLTGLAGTPVPVENPQTVAITPNARTALFSGSGALDLTPVDTVAGTAGTPIGVNTFGPVAIAPDGKSAWVGDNLQEGGELLQRVDLATRAVTTVGLGGGGASDVAITPDGATVYVSGYLFDGRRGVLPVSTATGAAGPIIAFQVAGSLAITPNGRTLFAVTGQGVVPIDVATNTPGRPLAVAARDVATTPDGATVWATTPAGMVSIDVATHRIGAPIAGTEAADTVEITPSGGRALVQLADRLVPVDLRARTVGMPLGISTSDTFAITPSQAPVAVLSTKAARHGLVTSFDASASVGRSGRIVRYAWQFGDGTSRVTSYPRIKHVYAHAGAYRVVLTVTDWTGTSTRTVFTGHQMMRNGGPAAQARLRVVVR